MNNLTSEPYACLLQLEGQRVIVCGGGKVATARVKMLLDAGAHIVVIAPEVSASLLAFGLEGRLVLERRMATNEDLEHAALVFIATNVPEINQALCAHAKQLGIFVNNAGDRTQSTFHLPAQTKQGGYRVFVSTGVPGLSLALLRQIETTLSAPWHQVHLVLSHLRQLAREHLPAGTRRSFLRSLTHTMPQSLGWSMSDWATHVDAYFEDQPALQFKCAQLFSALQDREIDA